MISASSIMSGDRRSITVDSDMEEASDGDVKNDGRGGQEKPSTTAAAGLTNSQSKGKQNQGNTKKQVQQQGAKENYPVYQPSPILSKPSFEAAAMPNEEAADTPTTSKRKSHKCLWLALLCIILIVIAVPIAVVLTRNSRDNGNATSSSQSADSSRGGNEGTDNTSGGGTNAGNGDGESSSGATSSPTAAPLKDSPMLRVIQSVTSAELLADSTTPQAKAAQWLVNNEGTYDYQGSDSNRLQRYALSVLGFALFPVGVDVPLFGDAADSECEWRGVYCGTVSNATLNGTNYWTMIANETNSSSGVITELVWAQQELSGSIPTEIALLSSLEYLDFGENALTGVIPEDIFSLSSLQRLFLQNNQLQGTLSESFSQLERLVTFYGGNNLFTGAIPQGLGSAATGTAYVRPLRYLSLHRNQLVGTIPINMNLRELYYMDLSYNNLTGGIPLDWMEGRDTVSTLHQLYLDHNKLSGSLPTSLASLGNGRVEQLFLSDNQFYGTFPANYQDADFLQQLEIQRNLFTAIDPNLCYQLVFEGGEVVNFKADCAVCTCTYECDQCVV